MLNASILRSQIFHDLSQGNNNMQQACLDIFEHELFPVILRFRGRVGITIFWLLVANEDVINHVTCNLWQWYFDMFCKTIWRMGNCWIGHWSYCSLTLSHRDKVSFKQCAWLNYFHPDWGLQNGNRCRVIDFQCAQFRKSYIKLSLWRRGIFPPPK